MTLPGPHMARGGVLEWQVYPSVIVKNSTQNSSQKEQPFVG